MSAEDWEGQNAKAWIQAMGEFGDDWRMLLVNPVILSAAKWKAQNPSPFLAANMDNLLSSIEKESVEALKLSSDYTQTALSDLVDWHRAKMADKKCLSGLTLLDLGCGEAYLGRWLSAMGSKYIGIDVSESLTKTGDKKLSDSIGRMNLDGERFDPQKATAIISNHPKPDIITIVLLLEHLSNPLPLLEWIADTFSAPAQIPLILLFTLNWDYYFNEFSPDTLLKMNTSYRVAIASSKATVSAYYRSQRDLLRLIRDSFLVSHYITPLYFPADTFPNLEPEQSRGIAPFYLHILAPHRTIKENISRNALPAKLKAYVHESAKITRLTFQKDAVVVQSINMGGDLFYVEKGAVSVGDLSVGDPFTFGADTLLGDLEIEYPIPSLGTDYIYPVRAQKDQTTILRISAHDIAQAFNEETFGISVFHALRKRVIESNWLHCGNSAYIKKTQASKVLPVAMNDLDRSARIILQRLQAERHLGLRDPSGRAILWDASDSIDNDRGALATPKNAKLLGVTQFFCQVGILDAFAPPNIRQKFNNLFGIFVTDVLNDFIYSFRSGLTSAQAGTGKSLVSAITNRPFAGAGFSQFTDDFQESLDRAMRELALSAKEKEVFTERIKRLMRVCYFSRPLFIVVNDEHMLKSIVLRDGLYINARLLHRRSLLRVKKLTTSVEDVFDREERVASRVRKYLQHLRLFIKCDAEYFGGQLLYSGSVRNVDMTGKQT